MSTRLPICCAFTERVRVNGQELADGDHCAAFAEVEARGDIAPPSSSSPPLAGLWLFRRAAPMCFCWKWGWGRLDATNVVESDVALIASIALDHCDWLGDTREAVAVEKSRRLSQRQTRHQRGAQSAVDHRKRSSAPRRLPARQVGTDFRGDARR